MSRILILFFLLALASCQPNQTQVGSSSFVETDPAKAGFIPDRLSWIDKRIQSAIDSGEVAGTVAIIAKDGAIGYHKAFGQADIAAAKPMQKNSIFRIASMSKLVTVVCALMLYERGEFSMDTNLGDILPEFKEMQVLEGWDEKKKQFITKPAAKPIQMKQLFSHTSGIGYPVFSYVGRDGFLAANVQEAFPDMTVTLEENVKRIAKLPLIHEPGDQWTYGLNMDVLGRVIEVIDGRPFARFMKEELLDPLGLKDTGFALPQESWDRVVEVYRTEQGKLTPWGEFSRNFSNAHDEWWKRDAEKIAMGGAGIVSTAYDYARFLQMLVNDGELEGTRILGRKTVELLRRPLFRSFDGESLSMGLSVWVLDSEQDAYTSYSMGSYGWGGYFYTSYWVDPKEKLVAVIMNQVNPVESALNNDFITLTYSALK